MDPNIHTVYDEAAYLCEKLEELRRNNEPSSEKERCYNAEFSVAVNQVAAQIHRLQLSRSADLSVIVMPPNLCGISHLEKIVKILRESMEIMQAEIRETANVQNPGKGKGERGRPDVSD